jgi:3',5'-nucleoside bisphosphate phosphatase
MRTKMIFNVMVLVMITGSFIYAQPSVNNIQLPELRVEKQRKKINVPDLEGYITLKCDFHMHTIFSDGIVWPTLRVYEAYYEGLDAISITDHIENNPSKPFVGGDDNSSYEIARDAAKDFNIMLVRGGEITRDMPPGHLNAIFLDDVNKLDTKDPYDAIMEAHKQGAFITWNHPGWKAQQPDTCIMFDEIKDLIGEGVIHGIEVFNEKEWYPIALGWSNTYDLAVTGYADIHEVTSHYYPLDIYHRPMTLVFARERTHESLKRAMFEKRTVAWFSKYVTGKKELLEELFYRSVSVVELPGKDSKGNNMIEINNHTDFIMEFQSLESDLPSFTLQPDSSYLLRYKESSGKFSYALSNWYTDINRNLEVSLLK